MLPWRMASTDLQSGVAAPADFGLDAYERMVRIRGFEQRVQALAGAGELPGATHLYLGQEAIAAGVAIALRDDDYITSTHRGHGHIIAKGGDLNRCMAELFGKATGYCSGKGGSMHLADLGLGIIGANGIVGAGSPIALGAALSARIRKTDQVSVAFFGDGAANAGSFHETLNLAALWALPMVFVCENNGWGQLTRAEDVTATVEIVRHAEVYGVPGVRVDGNDVGSVHEVSREAIERARSGEGPTLIEALTYRWREHSEGFEVLFGETRSPEEHADWLARDPVIRHRAALVESGVAHEVLGAIEADVVASIDAAVEFARSSPPPADQTALTDVWTSVGAT
jgi:TPP-dependent pyruvate/acetoin dehydrogenase alpha subunit